MEKGLIPDFYRVEIPGREILVSLMKAPQDQQPNTLIINTGEPNPNDVLRGYRATYFLNRIDQGTWGLVFAQMEPPPTNKEMQSSNAIATVNLVCKKVQQLRGEIIEIVLPGHYKVYALNGLDEETRISKVQPLGQQI